MSCILLCCHSDGSRQVRPHTGITYISKITDGVYRHLQQYFSYIVAVIFIVEQIGENHRPIASH